MTAVSKKLIFDFAGINYDNKFIFNDLPLELSSLAKSKFGYYACGHKDDPSKYKREYSNPKSFVKTNHT